MIRRQARHGRPQRKFAGSAHPQSQPSNATFTYPEFGAGTVTTLTFNQPMVLTDSTAAGFTGWTVNDGTNTRTVLSVAQVSSQEYTLTVSGALLVHTGVIHVPAGSPGLRTAMGGYVQAGNTANS